jgi:hypothetical protein
MVNITNTSGPIRIVIRGLRDTTPVEATKRIILDVFGGIGGHWTVGLAASDTSQCWNVAIRGPAGLYLFSFPGSASSVPDLLRLHLVRLLPRLVSESGGRARDLGTLDAAG